MSSSIAGIVFILISLFLITRRLFWILVFGLSTLGSLFAVIASVIHFQIFSAVALSVLTFILWSIADWIVAGYRR